MLCHVRRSCFESLLQRPGFSGWHYTTAFLWLFGRKTCSYVYGCIQCCLQHLTRCLVIPITALLYTYIYTVYCMLRRLVLARLNHPGGLLFFHKSSTIRFGFTRHVGYQTAGFKCMVCLSQRLSLTWLCAICIYYQSAIFLFYIDSIHLSPFISWMVSNSQSSLLY